MLNCKRAKFTIPSQVTYLNCAYMSPLLKDVEKEGLRAIRKKRNPSVIRPADFFSDTEELRSEFAGLVNAKDPSRVVVIPSVSYGIASVVKNMPLQRDQEILVVSEQFPSNYYPWETLAEETGARINTVAPPPTKDARGKKWNERILESITNKTAVVAIGSVHWADGTRFDLEQIRQRTNDVNAKLIVDGTQSVGIMPFDIQRVKPDALICAGYKWLLGPYSIGVAYYGPAFDEGKPIEETWMNRLDSENFAGLVNYTREYKPGALRYEVGEHSNFFLLPMLLKAVKQIRNWGVEQMQEYCQHITRDAIPALQEHGFTIEDPEWRGAHLFGMRLPDSMDLGKLKQSLLKHKVYVSYRGNAVRVAPNVYNTAEDFNRMLKAIRKM